MVQTTPPRSHSSHLSIFLTMTPRFVSWCRRKKSSVYIQDVTACFVAAPTANFLPAKCFLRDPKRWKSLPWIWDCTQGGQSLSRHSTMSNHRFC